MADYFFGPLSYFDPAPWQGLFLGAGLMVLLGAWDDVRPLGASTKFLVQLGAAGLALGFGFQIHGLPLLGHPISSPLLSIPLTLLWILLITNAFNLIDGLDGLSGGLAFIAGLTLLALSLVRGDAQTALLATVLCGAIGGFLKYNFHPASIFMGDSGSLFLGYVLSLIALRSSAKGVTAVAILAPLLALGLPLFDTLLAVARRFLRAVHLLEVANGRYRFLFAGGRGLFEADRDHVHHRLLDLGLSHRRAVLCLHGIGLALGVLAILSVIRSSFQYGLFLLVIVLASVAGLRKLGYRELEVMRRGLAPGSGPGQALGLFELPVLARPFFHPFFDLAMAATAYYGAFVLKADRLDLGPFKEVFLGTLFALLAAKLLPFYALGIYRRSWRHSNIADMIGLGKALLIGSLLFALPATLVLSASLPASLMVIDFLLLSFLTAGARTSFRLLEYVKLRGEERERRVLIYGAGRGGDRERRGTLLCIAPLLLHLRSKAGVPAEPAAGAEAGGASWMTIPESSGRVLTATRSWARGRRSPCWWRHIASTPCSSPRPRSRPDGWPGCRRSWRGRGWSSSGV